MDATTPNSPPTPQNDETPIPQNNKTPIPQNDAVTQQNEENPNLQNDTVLQPINNEIEETPIAQNDAVKRDVNQIEETPIPENDAVSREINAIEETPIPENHAAMLQNEENGETPIRQIDDIMRESNEIEGTPIAEDDAAVEKYNGIEETPNCENEVVKRETDRNEEKSITENDVLMREAEENDETQLKPNFGIDDAMVVDKKEEVGETPSRNGNVGAVGVEVGNGSNGNGVVTSGNNSKKKKKSNCVWIMRSSRKSKKRAKFSGNGSGGGNVEMDEERVLITPVTRVNPEKEDDRVDMNICLSKVFKAEKVELSEDRLTAGSCKGYRMVRATRGVVEGAWYFEIKVVHLGETGHTRLGWSNEKGDLQAPVGYDENSFGYRDTDGSKIHKALREGYGAEGYKEGDVIGCYISLPDGGMYAPKPQKMVLYKGQRYYRGPAESADQKEDVSKIVPGSVISFFKNGICQGVAYKDISGGRYYPAASMYTLPNQSNCLVRFNFGPEFDFFPEDFGEYPSPRPMIEVPYQDYDVLVENGNGVSDENKQ